VATVNTEVVIRRYKSDKAYKQDAEKLARQGYSVHSVVSEQVRSGCLRIILLGGFGALIWKPKPQLVVTYKRA
jgi:hypothetical protein